MAKATRNISKPDPIFAAIEAHRKAEAAFGSAVKAADHPGKPYPNQKKRNAVVAATSDAAHNAAIAILDTKPTTIAGIVAVMEYAAAYTQRGAQWPHLLQYPPKKYGETFEAGLFARLATTLKKIGGR